jgi:hypothetical protein
MHVALAGLEPIDCGHAKSIAFEVKALDGIPVRNPDLSTVLPESF